MNGYTYLASPYTDPDPEVREMRFEAACIAAAWLMQQGHIVFCPIAHSHPIDIQMPSGPESGEFWKRQDHPFLAGASSMVVLMIPGWEKSTGVQAEIDYAHKHNIKVEFIEP